MNSLDSTSKKTNMRYGMLSLVFINVVINYLDRSNLSVAASGLGEELKLSSVELGLYFFGVWLVVCSIANPGRFGGGPDHPQNSIRSLPDHLVLGDNSPGVCQWLCQLIRFSTGDRSFRSTFLSDQQQDCYELVSGP